MSAGRRYALGLGVVALLGAVAMVLAPPEIRSELGFGLGLGLLIQAPLGWFTVRSIGTERFQPVWVLGMMARMAVVALAGLVVVPALGWELVPALGTLVAMILVLLVLEVGTAMRDNSGIKAR